MEEGQYEQAHSYIKDAWELAGESKEDIRVIADFLQLIGKKRFEEAKSAHANYRLSSGGVVYRKTEIGPKVVLLHRRAENTWHLPKGIVEYGETFEIAALREVREETGIEGEIICYLTDIYSDYYENGKNIPKRTIYYLIEAKTETLRTDFEHDSASFLPIEEAKGLLLNYKSAHEFEMPVVEVAYPLIMKTKA
jgi:8-oxo-dGTP diphosphatase